jgi:putative drug exporter of the RND superfamily
VNNSPAPASGPARDAILARLAGWCFDHRRTVLAAWLIVAVAVIGIAVSSGSQFSDNYSSASLASQRAQDVLNARFPGQAGATVDVVMHSPDPLTSGQNSGSIARLVSAVRSLPHVSSVTSPLAPGGRHQLSADSRTGFAVVQFNMNQVDLPNSAALDVIHTALGFAHPGLQVAVGGAPADNVVSAAPGSSEGIGITAAIVIMLLAFGSVVAMGLPLLIALIGVGLGFGIVDAASHALTIPDFGPDLMAMIGLGVGIDYALLIVTRYRQELAGGHQPREAAGIALSTAGRSAAFAGGTVVIALLGLLVINLPFMDGLAVGAIVAVLLVLTGALTLLPAMFGFAGHTIDRLHIPALSRRAAASSSRPPGHGFWYRWSRNVQRHPWVCSIATVAVLAVLAIPLFSMHQAFSDEGNDPPSLTTRQAYDLLSAGFGPGFNGPLIIVAELSPPGASSTGARGTVSALDARIRTVPDVASVAPAVFDAAGNAAIIVAYPATSPQATQTSNLVATLRDQVIPPATAGTGVTAFVGGETAGSVDAAGYLASRLPWVVAVVIGLGFILLMVAFRSLLVPLKAAVMNVLSIGAAYGVIVAVYQWGWLSAVFGVSRQGPIDPWIPLMIFAIVFGLSMDYEVFLVSRIQERWLASHDNSLAVAEGVAATARVITAAAAIMVCVFASFVINDPLRILNVFGLGLAVAIFVDATLVRMVLVPSVMQLLGNANWWLPHFLAGRVRPVTAARAGHDRAAGQPGRHGPEIARDLHRGAGQAVPEDHRAERS